MQRLCCTVLDGLYYNARTVLHQTDIVVTHELVCMLTIFRSRMRDCHDDSTVVSLLAHFRSRGAACGPRVGDSVQGAVAHDARDLKTAPTVASTTGLPGVPQEIVISCSRGRARGYGQGALWCSGRLLQSALSPSPLSPPLRDYTACPEQPHFFHYGGEDGGAENCTESPGNLSFLWANLRCWSRGRPQRIS